MIQILKQIKIRVNQILLRIVPLPLYDQLPHKFKDFNAVVLNLMDDNSFLLKIGAHTGMSEDFVDKYLLKSRWSGLLVEPVPALFKELRKNLCKNPKLEFENAAISETDGTKVFFQIPEDMQKSNPDLTQMGSLDEEVILKQIPELKDKLIKTKVKCMTLTALLEKHKIKKIDMFQIDAEGYDYKILKQLNFSKYKPKIVLYEHKHLSQKQKVNAEKILRKNKYHYIKGGSDTIGFLAS